MMWGLGFWTLLGSGRSKGKRLSLKKEGRDGKEDGSLLYILDFETALYGIGKIQG